MVGYKLGEKNRAKIAKDPHLRLLICPQCGYLSKEPTIATCEHRFCRSCLEIICFARSSEAAKCPTDGHPINFEECHQDKLAAEKINALDISCEVETCHWHGRVWHLEDHMKKYHSGHNEEGAKLGKQGVFINNVQQQLSAFSDAVVNAQGYGQLENEVRDLARKIQGIQQNLTGNGELRQQLETLQHKVQTLEEQVVETLQHKVQTLEEQVGLQKDQCGKCHNKHFAEKGRVCEERNMEVEILQGSISHLQRQLADLRNCHAVLQNNYATLQIRQADLENRHTDLQNRHDNLQTSHTNLQQCHANLQQSHDALQAQVSSSEESS